MSEARMEEAELEAAFGALGPEADQIARMRTVVLASYAAQHQSLTAEWIALLRVRPVSNSAYIAAAAAALLLGTPLGSLFSLLWTMI